MSRDVYQRLRALAKQSNDTELENLCSLAIIGHPGAVEDLDYIIRNAGPNFRAELDATEENDE